MMLGIGVGIAPRAPRALQTQPAQGLMLFVTSDDAVQQVNAKSLVIEVAPPSAHAGSYPLLLADLARGPVCLALPGIRPAGGTLHAEPGLWAYDAARGSSTVTRQWLVDGVAVRDATGPAFTPPATAAGQSVVLTETVRQNGLETAALSAPHTLPGESTPETPGEPPETPEESFGLSVASDARLVLIADPAGTAGVTVIEPAAYAGSYTIPVAELTAGPLWLVPARIQGTGQTGSTLSVLHPGLPLSDAGAGPLSRQGQWHRDGTAIPGATAQSYVVQGTDSGHRIGFLESATNRHGTRQQMSNEIAIGGTQ